MFATRSIASKVLSGKRGLTPSGRVSESLEAIEDQIQPELELVRVGVAGLHGVLDDHLDEIRVRVGGQLPQDCSPTAATCSGLWSGRLICCSVKP